MLLIKNRIATDGIRRVIQIVIDRWGGKNVVQPTKKSGYPLELLIVFRDFPAIFSCGMWI